MELAGLGTGFFTMPSDAAPAGESGDLLAAPDDTTAFLTRGVETPGFDEFEAGTLAVGDTPAASIFFFDSEAAPIGVGALGDAPSGAVMFFPAASPAFSGLTGTEGKRCAKISAARPAPAWSVWV